ncbi:MAG: hypothetical protein K6G42_07555 [Lachnospiraceae bacterium]|nr:hypothetical protein [Lachnospiraceae bacterium]
MKRNIILIIGLIIFVMMTGCGGNKSGADPAGVSENAGDIGHTEDTENDEDTENADDTGDTENADDTGDTENAGDTGDTENAGGSVEPESDSFEMFGENTDLREFTAQDYYGVFVSSSKDPDKLESCKERLEEAGFIGSFAVYTPDFDKLNPEPYYAATTGLYTSEIDANDALSDVKDGGFTDAYVKHAGSYIGDKYWYTMHGDESIELLKDGAMLRGVSVSIPYPTDNEAVISDLIVPKDAIFDKSANMSSFGNYEQGDTPYEWIVRNHDLMNEDIDQYLKNGPALSGVFEIGLDNNRITTYYGSYWWD